MLAKLFGKPDRGRDEFERRAPGTYATSASRPRCTAGCSSSRSGSSPRSVPRSCTSIGGNLAVSGTHHRRHDSRAFAPTSAMIYQPLAQLTNSRVDVLTALVSFERVFEVLDFPAAIIDRPDAVDLVSPSGRVEFDHVWFRHPPGREEGPGPCVSQATRRPPPGRPATPAAVARPGRPRPRSPRSPAGSPGPPRRSASRTSNRTSVRKHGPV